MIFSGLNRRATSSVNFWMARRETIVCINAVSLTGNGPAVKTTSGPPSGIGKGYAVSALLATRPPVLVQLGWKNWPRGLSTRS